MDSGTFISKGHLLEFISGIRRQAFWDLDFICAVINVSLCDPGRSERFVDLVEGGVFLSFFYHLVVDNRLNFAFSTVRFTSVGEGEVVRRLSGLDKE